MLIGDITSAFRVQCRVVYALILRETKTRYGKHKLGYLWALFEPALQVSVFVAIFVIAGRKSVSGMPVVLFVLTGITPFLLFRNTMQQTLSAIDANRALLTFPQVKTFDLILARALLETATLVLVFFILLLIASAFGQPVKVDNLLGVFSMLLLLSVTGLGLGMAFASFASLFPSVKQMVSALLGRPLYFTSGLFFTAEVLPPVAREILLINPLLHMIEILRSAFFYDFNSQYADLSYATATAMICLCFGLLIHRALQNRVLTSD